MGREKQWTSQQGAELATPERVGGGGREGGGEGGEGGGGRVREEGERGRKIQKYSCLTIHKGMHTHNTILTTSSYDNNSLIKTL